MYSLYLLTLLLSSSFSSATLHTADTLKQLTSISLHLCPLQENSSKVDCQRFLTKIKDIQSSLALQAKEDGDSDGESVISDGGEAKTELIQSAISLLDTLNQDKKGGCDTFPRLSGLVSDALDLIRNKLVEEEDRDINYLALFIFSTVILVIILFFQTWNCLCGYYKERQNRRDDRDRRQARVLYNNLHEIHFQNVQRARR